MNSGLALFSCFRPMSDDTIQIDIIVQMQGLESIQKLQGAFNGLRGSISDTEKQQRDSTKTNYRNMTSWGDLSGHLTKTEQSLDAVWRAGVHMKALGQDLIGISKDIIGTGIGVVNSYRDYDFTLRRTAVALNTNTEWQGKLDSAIQQTAISVGKFSPVEVANAYYLWGAATGEVVDNQKSLSRITATVTDILIATAMAGGNLESNIKGIYGVLQQYNLDMGKAGFVTRVLTVLTERTAADFGDLTGAFTYTGSAMGNLGVKFEDTAQVLGILADAGFRGTKAGRGLSMVFEGIVSPTSKGKRALDALARSVSNGAKNWKNLVFPKGKFIGMRGLVDNLAKSLQKMTPYQRQVAINSIFTNNATRALLPVIKDQIALWDKQRASGEKLTSVLDEQKYSLTGAAGYFDTLSGQFRDSIDAIVGSFQNSFFPIIQMVAVSIMELAKPVLGELKKGIVSVGDWLKANPWAVELAVKVGAAIAVVTGLVGIFFLLIGTLIPLGAGIAFFVKGLSGVVFAFTILGGIIAAVGASIVQNVGGIRDQLGRLGTEVFDLLRPAQKSFNDFALTVGDIPSLLGPVLQDAITKVADAVGWLADQLHRINNDPSLRSLVSTALVAVGVFLAWTVTWKTIGGLINSALGAFWALNRIFSGIGIASDVFFALPGPLKLIGVLVAVGAALWFAYENNVLGFRDAVQGVSNWLNANLPSIIGQLQTWVTGVATFFATVWSQIVSTAQSAFSTISSVIIGILQPILTKLPAAISFLQGIFDQLSSVYGPVIQNLGEVWNGVWAQIGKTWNETMAQIEEHLGPLIGRIQELVGVIYNNLGPVWDAVVSIIGVAVGIIIKLITQLLVTVAPIVQGIADFIMRTFGIAVDFLIKVVGDVVIFIIDRIENLVEIVEGIIKIFSGILQGDWGEAWDGVVNVVSGATQFIGAAIALFISLFLSVIDTGLKAVTGIFEFIFGMKPGSIYNSIKGFISTMLAFGGDVINGLVSGVSGAIGGAVSSVTGFIGQIVDGIKGFLGIHSPSTVLADIGKNVVEGLWNGILSLKDWIIRKLSDFIKNVIPGPIKDVLHISSPSKVMAELGTYIVQGLAVGISSSDDALRAMTQTTNDLLSVASDGADRINMALDNATSTSLGSGISISSANKRTIVLQVEVTSPDGSVSQLDTTQLADLIKGPDLVSALEHMAANA